MWILVSASLGSLVVGFGLFALLFRPRSRWAWGYLLALLSNLPLIVLAYLLVTAHETTTAVVALALLGMGVAGFGVGSVAGMITVTVLGSPRSCDPPQGDSV